MTQELPDVPARLDRRIKPRPAKFQQRASVELKTAARRLDRVINLRIARFRRDLDQAVANFTDDCTESNFEVLDVAREALRRAGGLPS